MATNKTRLLPEAENVTPHTVSDARKLIGKRVEYLRACDIDRSGRGYIFPQTGTVLDAKGRNICVNDDWISFSNLREMRILTNDVQPD